MKKAGSKALIVGMVALVLGVTPAAASAALTPNPTSYDWGNIDRYQQSSAQAFDFTNHEGVGVSAGQAQLTGLDAAEFSISSDGCNGASLADGDSCQVQVFVNPQSVGPKSASLEVDDGFGTASVPLS